ncbi:MAG: hypothetical protein EAZ97_12935 [Bacteroidetes bacterium]|nr:MAG: hypothetical protein EAZ97_12935 [Bacteroidota bacterium]
MNSRFFCVILLFFGIYTTVLAQNDLRFLRPDAEILSENNVYDFVQDQSGFIWLATANGICRYDGYSASLLQSHLINRSVFKQEIFRSLLIDKQGYLWAGSRSGKLYRYKSGIVELIQYADSQWVENKSIEKIIQAEDGTIYLASWGAGIFSHKNGKWINFKHDPKNPNSLSSNDINCILESKQGDIWAGAWHGGLNRYKNGKFIHYLNDPKNPFSAMNDNPRCLFEDSRGRIWVGFWGSGVARIENEKFIHYKHDPKNPKSISGEKVLSITETPNGIIWVGCWGGGLNAFENDQFTRYLHNPQNQASIGADEIEVLKVDKQGSLWIGMHSAGLNRMAVSPFASYRHHFFDKNNFNGNLVHAIICDSVDRVWIGSVAGISILEKGEFKQLKDNSISENMDTNGVVSLLFDKKGALWIGRYDGGLSRYQDGKFTYFKLDGYKNSNILTVLTLYESEDGKIYAGIENGGLTYYENGKFYSYKHSADANSISSNKVTCITEKKGESTLWVGTSGGGLNRLKDGKFKHFLNNPKDSNSLSDDNINHIYYAKNGILWIATNNGLNSFDEKNNKFEVFNKKNGFLTNVIQSIVEDNSGNLWLGTIWGLAKFNPKTKKVQTFTLKDGLQNQNFNQGAVGKSADGRLFFGDKGVIHFYPSKINLNTTAPTVVLTDFHIFNRAVELDSLTTFSKPFHELTEIILDHTQNVFSFHFAALNYKTNEKNQYSYYLEGFEKDWNEASFVRSATYTNIPSGEYVFRVKASNNDGVWNNEGFSIKVIILPPFWKTWWFVSLLLLTLVSILVSIYKIRTKNLKRQKEELENQVKIRTAELEVKQSEVIQKNAVLNKQKQEIQRQRDDILEKSESLTKQKEEIESQRDYILEKNADLQQQKEEIETQRDAILEKNADLQLQNEEIQFQRNRISRQKEEIENLFSNIQAFTLIGQKITSILDLENMIATVYEYVNELMDASAFGIGIYNENLQRIEFNGFMEDGKFLPFFYHDLSDKNRYSVWCAQHKKPILMNDVDAEYMNYVEVWLNAIEGKNAQSLIYLPLFFEEKVIGVMTVQSWEINAYQEQDLTMIKGVASYIAIALTNANNYQLLNSSKHSLQQKNTQITDSIRYAQTIQEAILPTDSQMKQMFGENNYFVLFKPKDIVSGDFYWAGQVGKQNLIAVIDCTGHGVPGAFMSMISNTLLDEIVYIEKITEPKQVLITLNQKVVAVLKQEEGNNKDGMDLSFLKIERQELNHHLSFSGAKRPLVYVKKQDLLVCVTEGSRKSIGGFQNNKEFIQNEIYLNTGDCFYLFTDGFIDQNSPKGVRFGSKTFYQLLENMFHFELSQQRDLIERSLNYHQAEMEQRDDITLIGIKLA